MGRDGLWTISELARLAGLRVSSIRFYERRGLVAPTGRSNGNYRLYDQATLDRLRFITAAKSAGFTLADIAVLLTYRDGDTSPCDEVQGLIASRLARVERELEHLHHVRQVLSRWLAVCRRAARTGRCGVLEGLSQPARATPSAVPEETKGNRARRA